MRTDRHPTLSDVARLAGVGTATASRVINGGSRVSAKAIERVQRAITELGFIPNMAARVLKGEPSRTVALIVPSIADPFFANCAEAIQKVARSFGSLLVVTVTHNDPAVELESIEALFRRTDGLLLAPSMSDNSPLVERLAGLAIPVVCFDRPLRGMPLGSVLTDNYHAAKTATRHLLQHGYDDILCVGGEASFYTMTERVRGYKAAMREAKRVARVDVVTSERGSEEIAALLIELRRRNALPRAIFCLKNSITTHVYHALHKLDIAIPEEVALVGYDDFLLAADLRPAITVVQQPVEEIGRRAAALLFDSFHKKHSRPAPTQDTARTIRLNGQLILRESCGCRIAAEPNRVQPE